MTKNNAKKLIEHLKSDNRFKRIERFDITHILAIPSGADFFHKWLELYLLNEENEKHIFSQLPDNKDITVYSIVYIDGFLLFEDVKDSLIKKQIHDYDEYFN